MNTYTNRLAAWLMLILSCVTASRRGLVSGATEGAPPSIVSPWCHWNKQLTECRLPLILVQVSQPIVLHTQFSGVGPFSVVWTVHGKVLECSTHVVPTVGCVVTRGNTSTYEYETVTILAPHMNVTNASGMYRANVTNPYGYNTTATKVDVNCSQIIDPPISYDNNNVTLTEYDTKNVTLGALGSTDATLWICYTTDKYTTMWNISLNDSCLECWEPGFCDTLHNRPQWRVWRRDVKLCVANYRLELTVQVKDVRKRDAGNFFLAWSSPAKGQGPQTHDVLTKTSLTVTSESTEPKTKKEDYKWYIIGGAGGGVGLVILIAVVVVTVVLRKKRRPLPRRQRRPGHRRGGGGVVRVGRGNVQDPTDTESEALVATAGATNRYGGIPNQCAEPCNNNDTTSAPEDDREVFLHTSEDEVRDV